MSIVLANAAKRCPMYGVQIAESKKLRRLTMYDFNKFSINLQKAIKLYQDKNIWNNLISR